MAFTYNPVNPAKKKVRTFLSNTDYFILFLKYHINLTGITIK